MRKILITAISIMLIFALTGCTSNDQAKVVKDEYVPKKEELVGIPVYPKASLYFDSEITVVEDEDTSYWSWTYSTTGTAKEIVEFFKAELLKMGYEIERESTDYYAFSIKTSENQILIASKGIGKANKDKSYDEVNADTPGRDYDIRVNLDKWNSR